MGCVYLYQGQQFKTKEALVSFLNSASLQNNSTTQGQTSTLFERLMNQYGRKKAKELYEYLFSDEFVNQYGDWTIGESTLELNEQGEPEVFFYPNEILGFPEEFDEEEGDFYEERRDDTTTNTKANEEFEKKEKEIKGLRSHFRHIKQLQLNTLFEQRKKIQVLIDDPNTSKQLRFKLIALSKELTQLNKQLKADLDVIKQANILELFEFAKSDLKTLTTVFANNNIPDNLDNYNRIIDFWYAITTPNENNTLIPEDFLANYKEQLRELNNQFAKLRDDAISASKRKFVETVNKETDSSFTMKDLFKPFKKIGFITKYLRDISVIDNPIINFIYRIVKHADDKARIEANKVFEEFNKLLSNVQKKLGKGNYELFLQKDINGNKTGRLVAFYTPEYYKLRGKLNKAKDENDTIELTRLMESDEYKNNIYDINLSLLYNNNGKKLSNYDSKINEIKAIVGEHNIDKVINHIENKLADYLLNREYEISISDDNGAEWMKNNPISTIISATPRYYDLSGKVTNMYDKSYADIQNDEVLRSFYTFMVDTFNEMHGYLPYSITRNNNSKALPFVRTSMMNDLKDGDFNAFTSRISDLFVNQLSAEMDTVEQGVKIDPVTNKPIDEINTQLGKTILDKIDKVHRLLLKQYSVENNKDVIDISESVYTDLYEKARKQVVAEQSFDLEKLLKLYIMNTLHYKERDVIKETIRLAQRQLNDIKTEETTNSGKQTTSFGKLLASLQTDVKDTVNNFISVVYYRKASKDATGITKKRLKTADDRQEERILNEMLASLNKQLAEGIITEEQHIAKTADINKRKEKLGVLVVGSGIGDMVLKMVQTKSMGLNAPAAFVNLGIGAMSNYIEAAGEQFFTIDELNYGYSSLFMRRKQLEGLMHYFNVLKKGSEEIFDKSVLSWIYILQDRTEYMNQGPVLIAALKHAGLLDRVSKEGVPNFTKEEEKEFKLLIDQLVSRIHGNYDPTKPLLGTRKWSGRAMLQFRKWAIEGFANRFEVERTDNSLKAQVKGRYRSGWNFITNGDGFNDNPMLGSVTKTLFMLRQLSLKTAMTVGISPLKKVYDSGWNQLEVAGIKEVDIANLKRNMQEAVFYVMIMGLATLFKALGEDDEDDFQISYIMYNQLLRLQTDILFYTNPDEFNRIVTNPIASMRLYTDMSKVIGDYIDVLHGDKDENLQSSTFKGENRTLINIMKTLPISSQILRLRRLAYEAYD